MILLEQSRTRASISKEKCKTNAQQLLEKLSSIMRIMVRFFGKLSSRPQNVWKYGNEYHITLRFKESLPVK
ncbi:hypothetical protein BPAE_0224g00120 [Botrytis paeoniae]|uniref:Uncharacterized protein n=1 Tax=Botrytis paeoniae TaxID=278948 RepID=A0A4Z1F9B9_9HELO|nr:hypothetical protein BPAE_0224g00120 [Botrytis paeoniae]